VLRIADFKQCFCLLVFFPNVGFWGASSNASMNNISAVLALEQTYFRKALTHLRSKVSAGKD